MWCLDAVGTLFVGWCSIVWGEADMWTQKDGLTIMMWLGMLLLPGCFVSVQAVEFGEVTMSSFAGQALLMEVELTALSPEESLGLQVKQAGRDVYRGANIRFNPVLSSLRWSVQQRDRRMFLRVSTERPVNATYLNMFFEMGSKGDFAVRALTVWLDPDPKGRLAAEDLIDAKDLPEQGGAAFQPDVAELPVVQLDRSPADKQHSHKMGMGMGNHTNSHTNSHTNTHTNSPPRGQCSGAQRSCIAAERENVIISAHIEELEKTVKVLRKAILPQDGSVEGLEKPEGETEATSASVPPSELFLKKEEPLLPKPPPVVKVLPWAKISLAAAGLLAVLAGLAYFLYSQRKKKRGLKSAAGKPVPKAAKTGKNSRWQLGLGLSYWLSYWRTYWRNKFFSKWQSSKSSSGPSDGQAELAPTQNEGDIDALVDEAVQVEQKGAGKVGKFAQLRLALLLSMQQKMGKLTALAHGVRAKFGKKGKPVAATESET